MELVNCLQSKILIRNKGVNQTLMPNTTNSTPQASIWLSIHCGTNYSVLFCSRKGKFIQKRESGRTKDNAGNCKRIQSFFM